MDGHIGFWQNACHHRLDLFRDHVALLHGKIPVHGHMHVHEPNRAGGADAHGMKTFVSLSSVCDMDSSMVRMRSPVVIRLN